MTNSPQFKKIEEGKGFIAALDQSGGSTPKALKNYGIDESQYSNDEDMFALVHKMRERIITAPPFHGDKILGAILFEKTMDDVIEGLPTARYLWDTLDIVPFLKIDKGLDDDNDGVQLMKPIPDLDLLLERAKNAGIFGTKMRSVINKASTAGISEVVAQQFEIGKSILSYGLVPIIEPEISINAQDKQDCEVILKAEIMEHLNALEGNQQIMLKLTLPEAPNFYRELIDHPNCLKVVALSGGYDLDEACQRLASNDGMVASFSRALTNDLNAGQTDEEFNKALQSAIDRIYNASVHNEADAKAA
mgnify:CR=1 FL=1